jgi:HSP20 family protein
MIGLRRRENETALARPLGMELTPWHPWTEFTRLRDEMDRLFDGVLGRPPRMLQELGRYTPAVDLYETADEVVLNVHLPGISREDIHLGVEGDTLHITGETKPSVPEKEVTVHQAQGAFGRFDLRYTMPATVMPDKCKAVYRNGLLEVRLPKVETTAPPPVEIPVEG